MAAILYPDLSYAVVGAAIQVHRILGPGFLEAVYQRAFSHELGLQHINFVQHLHLPVAYKGVNVGDYEADFVISVGHDWRRRSGFQGRAGPWSGLGQPGTSAWVRLSMWGEASGK